MKWRNEKAFDGLVYSTANRLGVDPLLVLAVIGQESRFDPQAIRQEPAIGDASRGLMQILFNTAKGEGYTGSPLGLMDPAANIEYGTRYLKRQLDRVGGDPAAAVSAYNGGYRPALGFGAVATKPLRICLARSQTTGECVRWQDVKTGEFSNKPHVDAVMANYAYFKAERFKDVEGGGSSTAGGKAPPSSGAPGGLLSILLAGVGLVAGVAFLLAGDRKRSPAQQF